MSRRNQRHSESPPLDFTQLPPAAPKPKPISAVDPARARQRREYEAAERQHQARINGGIDWYVCLVPGCGQELSTYFRPTFADPEKRDHTRHLPLCIQHQLVVWHNVQATKRDPLVIEASEGLLDRVLADQEAAHQKQKAAHLARRDGHMYFIQINDLIKVGWTRDLHDRLRHYGASAELLAHYPATRDDETNLHRQLRPALAKGREWYHHGDILRMYLAETLAKHGPPTVKVTWTEPKDVIRTRRR